ncbi:cytochrome C [Sandarakinorhabdus rubra]|uniref:cytochrome C n=1 Tax=Sandarakinorhabdus rubra TaxID=2672568 RepID=UPI001969DF0E|nr:cytochrome C [Sandarakinorhabdus rubra]
MRVGVAMAAMLALASAAAAQRSATPPPVESQTPQQRAALGSYSATMTQPQSDYVEHCGGCHGIHGNAAPADLPTLQNRVGWFMCLPEGRAYLVRLPNVSRSRVDDNDQLAELLNFMVFGLGGASVPAGAAPFTGAEVARHRTSPFTSVSLIQTRKLLVEKLIRQCKAPASLRLMYPGQTAPAPTAARPGAGTYGGKSG